MAPGRMPGPRWRGHPARRHSSFPFQRRLYEQYWAGRPCPSWNKDMGGQPVPLLVFCRRCQLAIARLAETWIPGHSGACLRQTKARGDGAGTCARIAVWCSAYRATMTARAWCVRVAVACCESPSRVNPRPRCWRKPSKRPPDSRRRRCPTVPPRTPQPPPQAASRRNHARNTGRGNAAAIPPRRPRRTVRRGNGRGRALPGPVGRSDGRCAGC